MEFIVKVRSKMRCRFSQVPPGRYRSRFCICRPTTTWFQHNNVIWCANGLPGIAQSSAADYFLPLYQTAVTLAPTEMSGRSFSRAREPLNEWSWSLFQAREARRQTTTQQLIEAFALSHASRARFIILVINLGFRFAPPQALRFHPLRGFGKGDTSIECVQLVHLIPIVR